MCVHPFLNYFQIGTSDYQMWFESEFEVKGEGLRQCAVSPVAVAKMLT